MYDGPSTLDTLLAMILVGGLFWLAVWGLWELLDLFIEVSFVNPFT